MSDRDALLADLQDVIPASDRRLENAVDWLLDRGWRKVDPDSEIHTEWGVRRPEKYGSTVAWVGGRRPAESLAQSWGEGNVVVSRAVTAGPWREISR